jgi:hypothetical protein
MMRRPTLETIRGVVTREGSVDDRRRPNTIQEEPRDMRPKGYIVTLALAGIGVLALGGIAYAVTHNVSHASVTFAPSKVPKQSYKGGKITVHTDTVFAHPGDKAKGGFTHRVQIYFDDDVKFNTKDFPKCAGGFPSNTTMALAMAQCKNAKVGTGTASTAPPSNFPGCVLVFNGKPQAGKPTVVLYTRVTIPGPTADCSDPAHNNKGTTSVTLTGVLKGASGDLGTQLDVNNIDVAPLPLDDFTASIKRSNYVAARCHDSNKTWNYKVVHTYSGSGEPPVTVTGSQKCTRS